MIKILIADDHNLFREGLKQIFADYQDLEVAGEASNWMEVLGEVRDNDYDVVLLDISMPGRNGIERILAQEGCVGVRVYYGSDDQGTQKLVLVGVDANENDLDGGDLAELGRPCPPYCGQSNALNS